MKRQIIKLFVAFQRGRLYINMLTFFGIIEVIINQNDWSRKMYFFLIPAVLLFCIIIGKLDMKYVLKMEVQERNPLLKEIHNKLIRDEKVQKKKIDE
jgi:hypothetical protein